MGFKININGVLKAQVANLRQQELIESEFNLLGELNGETERFRKGIDYKFFLISQKV